jgi:hypothetical protein
MFYSPRVLGQLTQELLDAALLSAVNAMDLSATGHIIKRGCACLCSGASCAAAHSFHRLLEKKGRRQQFYDSW